MIAFLKKYHNYNAISIKLLNNKQVLFRLSFEQGRADLGPRIENLLYPSVSLFSRL